MTVSPILEARDVGMTLGNGPATVQALKGVSLSIAAGELALVMGPSGSGKTTLLSILGCILTQSRGTVAIAGQPTTGLDSEQLARLRREYIGFVFQSYNLFPALTAVENVRLALAVRDAHSMSGIQRAARALEAVGLGHKLGAYPRHLSGGEQQRVAIARAIAGEPLAILADEPTSALDGETGRQVMALLADVARSQRRAVLVVTHDPRVRSTADRIVEMEDGRIVGSVAPSDATTAEESSGNPAHA